MKAKRPAKTIATVFRAKIDTGWTKQLIYDQLTRGGDDDDESGNVHELRPKDLHDKDVQEWVDAEYSLRDDFPHEEDYVGEVEDLNFQLINKTWARKSKRG